MLKCCCYFFLFLSFCDSARILVHIPSPPYSHHVVFMPIIKELANRGHNITVLSMSDLKNNVKTPNIKEINLFDPTSENVFFHEWSKSYGKPNIRKNSFSYETVFEYYAENILLSEELQKLVNESYDLLLLEPLIQPGIILSHVFKVPVIWISPLSVNIKHYESMASPFHPFIYQTYQHDKNWNLSLIDKITNLYEDIEVGAKGNKANYQFDNWLRQNTNIVSPPIKDLYNNINALFWNTHPAWEPLPVPVNVLPIWGIIDIKPNNELPTELKTFLDGSTNGVIYMCFGSIVQPSLLPSEKIQMFVRVFSQLPYDVLWKWDNDDLPSLATNIRFCKWLPQAPSILRHPNIKLLITHGGLLSAADAMNAGVPMIGIPMIGDQWYSTEKYVHHKIGIQLQLHRMHDEDLRKAIDTVISDKSYRANVQKLGSFMRDQPFPVLQRAVWWIEHVLRHPELAHIRAPAANLSWLEYHQTDLLFIVVLLAFISISLVIYFVYFIFVKLFSSTYIPMVGR